MCCFGMLRSFDRGFKARANARNNTQHCWANIVVSCCAMCANARNKSIHVGSLDENTKDSGTQIQYPQFHTYDSVLCFSVVRVRRRNILGCAVQTNVTLLDHASMTAKQYKCWHLLALKFDQFQTSSNNFQQVATTHDMVCKRSQHVGPNNVASVCTGL